MREYSCPEEAEAAYKEERAEADAQAWQAAESARGEAEALAKGEEAENV